MKTGQKGSYKSVDFENLFDVFIEHTGREDVRVNAYHTKNKDLRGLLLNLDDYVFMLYMGKSLYQYTLPLIKNKDAKKFVDPPEDWLEESQILEIKNVTGRTLDKYCKKGYLTGVKSYGDVWYVKPDKDLFYWVAQVPDYGNLVERLKLIKNYYQNNPDCEEDLKTIFDMMEYIEDSNGIIRRGFQNKKSFKDLTVQNLSELGFEIEKSKDLKKNIDLFLEKAIIEKNKQYFLTK